MRYFFLIIFLGGLKSNAQVNAVQILDQLAGKLIQQYSKEAKGLVALHTDKTVYRAGSNIWFRAYSISNNGYAVSEKNKIIFVDLVNEKDSSLDRVLLNEESLQYHGAIRIPGNLPEGYYQLRAYTKSIIERSPSDIFITPVYIINDLENKSASNNMPGLNNSGDPVVQFYPEGMNLVNGVNSTVFFTATDKFGNPVNVDGVVKDRDSVITNFSGTGIGKFSFQPYSKDRIYKVYIKGNNATELVYTLPAINTGSYQLSLQEKNSDHLVFRVALGDSVYKNKEKSYLLGLAGGKICFASAGDGMYMVNIPLTNFPNGIADFYLYNGKQEMVSKRTVFIERNFPQVNISTDRQDYFSRQKANVNVIVTDHEGKPVKAVLSVAVTDSRLAEESANLHTAHLFLLQRNNSGTMALAGTNDYANLLAAILPEKGSYLRTNPEIIMDKDFYWNGLEVRGRITGKQDEALKKELVIMTPDLDNITFQDSTDETGAFSFRDIIFYGTRKLSVMIPAVYNKQQKYNIIPEIVSFPVIRTSAFSQNRYYNSLLRTLPDFKMQHADSVASGVTPQILQQLALQGKNKSPGISKKGLTSPRITAETLDKLGLSNTVDAVKMIPGVIMMNNRLTIRGGIQSPAGIDQNIEPLLIVDGVKATVASVVDYLNSIPPSNIDYIEVLKGGHEALYGTRGGNGVIVVKTSNQIRDVKSNDGKATGFIIAEGFHKAPAFFIPDYENDNIREAEFKDNRATIFWDGEIITDASGKANFSFYTADLKNDYTVTLQGITEKGELIHRSYTIKRK